MLMDKIRVIIADPLVIAAGLYVVTLFGTIATYVFGMQRGFNGSVDFLKKVLPGKREEFYHRVDFLMVSVLGSLLGLIVFAPRNAFQAIAAGCGWVGAVNVLLAGTGRSGAIGGGR